MIKGNIRVTSIRDRQITTNVKNQGEGCPTMYLLLVHIPLSQQWPGLVEGVMLSSYEEYLESHPRSWICGG